MHRTTLVAVSLLLAFVGVAAAATYKTGTYKAGSSTKDGMSLRISKGKFSLSRISFQETCTSSSDSFDERFTFVKGTQAKLNGKINSKGHLKGHYESSAGTVDITGSVSGSKATVKGSEQGEYTPAASTRHYTCKGSHTFKAKLVK